MSIPNGLPTLSAGAHRPHSGSACVMEYVSILAGEEWSDSPACTHPVLAAMARRVNDRLPDSERWRLARLVPSLIGTADTREDEMARRVLSMRLAVWCARQVLDQTPDRAAAESAIRAAEAWCECPCEAHRSASATTAYSASAAAAAASADPFALLTGLIAEHARLTGHTPDPAHEQAWASLDYAAAIN